MYSTYIDDGGGGGAGGIEEELGQVNRLEEEERVNRLEKGVKHGNIQGERGDKDWLEIE